MAEVIRGTTPTIIYKFSTITPSDLRTAIMTVKKGGEIKIERDLSTGVVEEDQIYWTLSQEETLLVIGSAEVMINWVTISGVRGASNKTPVIFEGNHIMEVI